MRRSRVLHVDFPILFPILISIHLNMNHTTPHPQSFTWETPIVTPHKHMRCPDTTFSAADMNKSHVQFEMLWRPAETNKNSTRGRTTLLNYSMHQYQKQ